MLGTIKMPLNMKLIQGELPGSNYETDKPKPKVKEEQTPMMAIAEETEENR